MSDGYSICPHILYVLFSTHVITSVIVDLLYTFLVFFGIAVFL